MKKPIILLSILLTLFSFSSKARVSSPSFAALCTPPLTYCDSLSDAVDGFESIYGSGGSLDYMVYYLNATLGSTHYDSYAAQWVSNDAAYWYAQISGCGIAFPSFVNCSTVSSVLSDFYTAYPAWATQSSPFIWSSYLNAHGAAPTSDISWQDWIVLLNACGISYPTPDTPVTACDSLADAFAGYTVRYPSGTSLDEFRKTINDYMGSWHFDAVANAVMPNDVAYWHAQFASCSLAFPDFIDCSGATTALGGFYDANPGYSSHSPAFLWVSYLNHSNVSYNGIYYSADEWALLLSWCGTSVPAADTLSNNCDSLQACIAMYNGLYPHGGNAWTFVDFMKQTMNQYGHLSGMTWLDNDLQYWYDQFAACSLSCPQIVDCTVADSIMDNFYATFPDYSASVPAFVWSQYMNINVNNYLSSINAGFNIYNMPDQWATILTCCGISLPAPDTLGTLCDSLQLCVNLYGDQYPTGTPFWNFTQTLNTYMPFQHYDAGSGQMVNNSETYWFSILDSCHISYPPFISCAVAESLMHVFKVTYPDDSIHCPPFKWTYFLNSNGAGTDPSNNQWWYNYEEWQALLNICHIGFPAFDSIGSHCDSIMLVLGMDNDGTAHGFRDPSNDLNSLFGWQHYDDVSHQMVNNTTHYWMTQIQACGLCTMLLNCDTLAAAVSSFETTYPQYATHCPVFVLNAYLSVTLDTKGTDGTSGIWQDMMACCGLPVPIIDTTYTTCDTTFVLRQALLQFETKLDTCLPPWLYDVILHGDEMNSDYASFILADSICGFTPLNVCDRPMATHCDSLNSLDYVFSAFFRLASSGGSGDGGGDGGDLPDLRDIYQVLYGQDMDNAEIVHDVTACDSDLCLQVTYPLARAQDIFGLYPCLPIRIFTTAMNFNSGNHYDYGEWYSHFLACGTPCPSVCDSDYTLCDSVREVADLVDRIVGPGGEGADIYSVIFFSAYFNRDVSLDEVNRMKANCTPGLCDSFIATAAANSASICAGSTATLTSSGGSSYHWSTGDTTGVIIVGMAGLYTVTITDSVGCTATASGIVTVSPIASATGDTVCTGGVGLLHASGGTSYAWSTGDSLPDVLVSVAGLYTVTVSDTTGCSATDTVYLVINSPSPVSVNDDTICPGENALLTVIGGTNCVWGSGPLTPQLITADAGTYTVVVTDSSGCISTLTATVILDSLPVITVSDTAICDGSVATLIATGGVTYYWSTNDASAEISTSAAGVYYVTGTDAYGCSSTDSAIVVVHPVPVPDGSDTTITRGSGAQLDDTIIGGTPPYTSVWMPSDGLDDSSSHRPTAGPLTTTTYVHFVTDSFGCSGSDTLTITVVPIDSPLIIVFTDTVIGVTDSLAYGDTTTIQYAFINDGGQPYQDSITISGGSSCDSCVHIGQLRVYVGADPTPIFTIDSPVFPIVLPVIDSPGILIRVQEDIYELDSCLQAGACTGARRLTWKSGTVDKNTADIPTHVGNRRGARTIAPLTVVISGPNAANPARTCTQGIYKLKISSPVTPFTINITVPAGVTVTLPTSVPGFNAPTIAGNVITLTANSSFDPATSSVTPYEFAFQETPDCDIAIPTPSLQHTVTTTYSPDPYIISDGSINSIANAPYTYVTPLLYPNLDVAAPQNPVGVSINAGSSTSLPQPLKCINNGTGDFKGTIEIQQPGLCTSDVRITSITIKDISAGTTIFSYTNAGGITMPYTTATVIIPKNHLFTIDEAAIYIGSPCTNPVCSTTVKIKWGCGTSKCNGPTTLYPVNFAPVNGNPSLVITRNLPTASGLTNIANWPWEGICPKSTTHWEYTVTNNSSVVATGVAINVDKVINTSYTYIDQSSVSTSAGTATFTALTSGDFPSGQVPACLTDLAHPIKNCSINVGSLGPHATVVVRFDTYRCCPSDAPFNGQIFFNQWAITAKYVQCSGIPVSASGAAGSISLNGWMSNQWHVTNLGLIQKPIIDQLDLQGVKGGCGSFSTFRVKNEIFNNTARPGYTNTNNTPDFDAGIFCQNPVVLGIADAQGDAPDGIFKVEVSWPGNLSSDVSTFVINKPGGATWHPINAAPYTTTMSAPSTSGGSITAYFDVAALGITTSRDFRNYFVGTYITFQLKTCCSNPVLAPTVVVQTSFMPQSTRCGAATCFIPLSQVDFKLQVHCPGCVTPGLIVDVNTFWRKTLGYEDADDDGMGDPVSSTTPTLKPITSTYGPLTSGQMQANASLVGDVLESTVHGFMYGGDAVPAHGGFSIGQWQTYWGGSTVTWGGNPTGTIPRLDHMYLEQQIIGGAATGMTLQQVSGAPDVQVKYKNHLTGVTTTANIPAANIARATTGAPNYYLRYLYHVTPAMLGIAGTHFDDQDEFTVVAHYTQCTNPANTQILEIQNEMFLTVSALPTGTVDAYGTIQIAGGVNLMGLNEKGFNPTTRALFYCSGHGCAHTVYPVRTQFSKNIAAVLGNICHNTLVMNYRMYIDAGIDWNVFPYEYRPINGVDPAHFSVGAGIKDPFTPFTALIPMQAIVTPLLGYVISPTRIFTDSKNYLRTVPLNLIRSETFASSHISHGTHDDYGLSMANAQYMPLADAMSGTITNIVYTTSLVPIQNQDITVNTTPTLMMGDEDFNQTFEFDISAICSDLKDPITNAWITSTTVRKDADYLYVPANIQSCAANPPGNLIVGNTTQPSPPTLTTPHPNLTAVLSNPTYAQNQVTFDLTLSASPYSPGLVYYIDVDPSHVVSGTDIAITVQNAGSTLTGISVGGGKTRYNVTGTNNNLKIIFTINGCSGFSTSNPTFTVPIYYAWSCQPGASNDPPPAASACNTPAHVDAVFHAYYPELTMSASMTPAQYKTCTNHLLDISITNLNVGGAGNMKLHIKLPASVPLSNMSFYLQRPSLSTLTASTSSYSISSFTSGGFTDYTVTLTTPTAFSATSGIVGADGYTTGDGVLHFTANIRPTCVQAGPFDVAYYLEANPYCDPTHSPALMVVPSTAPTTVATLPVSQDPNTAGSCTPVFSYTEQYTCGSASITVVPPAMGSPSPYTYQWSPSVSGSGPVFTLPLGNYQLTVTDHNGCAAYLPISVISQSSLTAQCASASFFDILGGATSVSGSKFEVTSIDADADGNIYAAGSYVAGNGVRDHTETGLTTPILTSSVDQYFLIKYNCQGQYVWSKTFLTDVVEAHNAKPISIVKVDPYSNNVYWGAGAYNGFQEYVVYYDRTTGTGYGAMTLQINNVDAPFLDVETSDPTGYYLAAEETHGGGTTIDALVAKFNRPVAGSSTGIWFSNFITAPNTIGISNPQPLYAVKLKGLCTSSGSYLLVATTGYLGIMDESTGNILGTPWVSSSGANWGTYCKVDVDPTGTYIVMTDGTNAYISTISGSGSTFAISTPTAISGLIDAKDVKCLPNAIAVATFNGIQLYSYSGTSISTPAFAQYVSGSQNMTGFFCRSLCLYGNAGILAAGPSAGNAILRNSTSYADPVSPSTSFPRAFIEKFGLISGAAFKTTEDGTDAPDTAYSVLASSVDNLTVIPNPAQNVVHIGFRIEQALIRPDIKVFDVLGQEIVAIPVVSAAGIEDLDVSSYAPGIYSVVLYNGSSKVALKRMVKK